MAKAPPDRIPELTAAEAAARRRANRRIGQVIVVVCILVALGAAAVMLTINRESAEEGARSIPTLG